MIALIAVGGEAPPLDRIAPLFSRIGLLCAADSGLDLFHAWGKVPELIVGDMDSLSDPDLLETYKSSDIIRLERAKDESDTEASIRICHERGADDFILVGGGGGRLDHLLALRALFERKLRPSEWHVAEDSVFLVRAGARSRFRFHRGSVVSVFPLAGGSRGMTSTGLRWPLAGLVWSAGHQGLSNEVVEDEVAIGAGEGDLLIVKSWRPS